MPHPDKPELSMTENFSPPTLQCKEGRMAIRPYWRERDVKEYF